MQYIRILMTINSGKDPYASGFSLSQSQLSKRPEFAKYHITKPLPIPPSCPYNQALNTPAATSWPSAPSAATWPGNPPCAP